MTTKKSMNRFASFLFTFLALTLLLPALLQGQSSGTGTIEGRVFNPTSGQYLEKARVTVQGTAIETFTDAIGTYRLVNVPSGSVEVRVTFTGMLARSERLNVGSGEVVKKDFDLAAAGAARAGVREGDVIKLDEMVVDAPREMTGAAFAINEQRHAANIKTVASADEFGKVAEGNAGEFLKFLPGVSVDANGIGGNARLISLNGVPPDYVPVTIGGFGLASAGAPNSTSRAVEIDMISINNMSRIEILFSPTPESPGMALAGTVNMVPRSSFERSKPRFDGSAYLSMRDNFRNLGRIAGPMDRHHRVVHPGFDFSLIYPVNRKFGFTLSGGLSRQFIPEQYVTNTWRGGGAPTNGGTLPNTTPDKPYLSTFLVADRWSDADRKSIGVTFDYKLGENNVLTLSYQYSMNINTSMGRALTFDVGRVAPGGFTTTSTQGFAGAGAISQASNGQARYNWTHMPTFTWRHDGPTWKANFGIGYSRGRMNDDNEGYFKSSPIARNNVTVAFSGITELRPGSITVNDGPTGAALDPYNLSNYIVRTPLFQPRRAVNVRSSVNTDLGRSFFGKVPVTVKGGLGISRELRDNPGSGTTSYTFVGRDGLSSTTSFTPVGSDDSAAPYLDATFSQPALPFGFPSLQVLSDARVLQALKDNPSYFRLDENNQYRLDVTSSKRVEEIISYGFLRGDISFLERRLKFTGGLRAEQTNIDAEGPLTDLTRNFQRDANGRVILGANGSPLVKATNALEVSKLTLIARGSRVDKEYLRLFPSLNASFDIRENLIARAAVFRSIGRPDFNQYSGGITLPSSEVPATAGGVITVNNAAIKPWSADSARIALEYYFKGVGLISIGGYHREFENFFGATQFAASPEFLDVYGLDPAVYGQYPVNTQTNVTGKVRMTGFEFNYKQALTFLPHWARGVQVFANLTSQRAVGPETANMSGYVPRTANWGWSLTRDRFSVRMNWNYRGLARRIAVTGVGIQSGTFQWTADRLQLDCQANFNLTRRISLFGNFRNLNDAPIETRTYGPSTPDYARIATRTLVGSLWTFGASVRY